MTAVLAHRGVAAAGGENTVQAFAEAARAGADGVELDARRTADGVLVVHHDAVLPGLGAIAHAVAEALPASVPTLRAAVEACGASAVVNVEVKNLPGEPDFDPDASRVGEIATEIARLPHPERLVVSCFHLPTVDAVRAAAPGLATAWLTLAEWDQHRALATAAERGHDGIHPRHEAVTPELVADARRRGLAVRAWTVNDRADLARMATAGVDAVITDDLATALEILRG